MALARAAGALSRASRRGGGTSFPGKLLLRMDPGAIARLLAPRSTGASVVVSATNGKTTTAGMIAAILRRGRAGRGAQPRGREHARACDGPPRSSSTAGDRRAATRAVRGRRGVAAERGRGPLPPHRAARQPLPRPARPLRRAREAGRRVERARRRPRRAHVVRAERRRPAGRRPRPRPRRRAARAASPTSASRTARTRSSGSSTPPTAKHCRRCGTAYAYSAAYLGHLGVLRVPELRQRAARARGGGAATWS